MPLPTVDWRAVYARADDDALNRSIQVMAQALDGALLAALDRGMKVTPPTWTESDTGPRRIVLKAPVLARVLKVE